MSQESRNRNSSNRDDRSEYNDKNFGRSSQRVEKDLKNYNKPDRYYNERDKYRGQRHRDDSDKDRDRQNVIENSKRDKDKYSRRYKDHDDKRYRDKSRSRERRRKKSRSKSSSIERKSHRKYSKKSRSHSIDRKLESAKYYNESLSRSITPKKLEDIKPRVTEVEEHKHHAFKSSMFKGMQNSYFTLGEESLDGAEGEIDKEKIHKEMQERLRQHLAAEGKIYPPPKPKASHPIFANDGSFLETFKKMQEQQQQQNEITEKQYERKHNIFPVYGKRRGGKILKTGIVDKPRPLEDVGMDSAKDAWSIYMHEVKKYKNTACDIATKTRPLLK